ncbi:MAG: c-type cytochrome [Candidatus Saccharimonas sp.]|nr:c-type cytochrome [Planctomycetaceae bacterium]
MPHVVSITNLGSLGMTPFRFVFFALLALRSFVLASTAFAQDEPPHSLDPRLKIELFAENPQIATPTGIDVDHAGRVWAIESNTHFPPEGYQGHPTDRVLVMEDKDGDRKADKITVFKDGLTHTMSIAVKPVWLEFDKGTRGPGDKGKEASAPRVSLSPPPLVVFIATRREILLCTDTDGDLKCDETKRLVHLETTGNYPHNGLAGFAFDALGNMFFGFGENLGADYKIIGSDGTTLSGGGEGGNVYRCRPDGSKLERWATGFWNPHASCFDAFGRLFTLDNDPDSRPPCRLLHIIPGGDYGYRFRNGRKGTHPFTSWNGEIPGTLPMVSGTGEAPSGIVCYESDGFPEDYLGTLLVGSWGDHRIDKFVLKPRGASFESMPQPVIKGGENFRPVGLALAPDGSLYVTDWVLKDYKLHGKGRVWRISAKEEPKRKVVTSDAVTENASPESLRALLASKRTDLRRGAAKSLSRMTDQADFLKALLRDDTTSTRSRCEILWAISQVPVELLNYHFQASVKLQDAPIRGRFDEAIVAAIPLLKTPQFLTERNDELGIAIDDYFVFGVKLNKSIPFHLASQVRVAVESRSIGERPVGLNEFDKQVTDALWESNYDKDGSLKLPVTFPHESEDPFLFAAKIAQHGSRNGDNMTFYMSQRYYVSNHHAQETTEWSRLAALLSARSGGPDSSSAVVRLGLTDESPLVRRAAIQWAGEEKLKQFRWLVESVLASEPMTGDLFMVCLASLSMLDGVPPAEFEKAPPVEHVLPIVKDAQRSASLRAIALRMLPPTLKELDGKLLGELVASTDEGLRREAVRTLGHSPIPERDQLLRGIAADESLDANLRADAVAGLAGVDHHAKLNDATRDLLVKLLRDKNETLTVEALRSLRGPAMAKADQPASDPKVTETLKQLDAELKTKEPGDSRPPLREAVEFAIGKRFTEKPSVDQPSTLDHQPSAAAGRRTFFHTNSAGCFKCHTVGGRGGQVGPDLTVIARTMDRQKLAESILEPSKEISPQFTTWAVETTSGKVLTGMLLGEEVNGDLRLGNNLGEVFFVPFKDIETRQPMKASIMPDKLHEQLTPTEFRDLIAYLETLK